MRNLFQSANGRFGVLPKGFVCDGKEHLDFRLVVHLLRFVLERFESLLYRLLRQIPSDGLECPSGIGAELVAVVRDTQLVQFLNEQSLEDR